MTDKQLPIAQALVAWADPLLASLSLARHCVDKTTQRHPSYPAVPAKALLLRAYTAGVKGRPNQGVSWTYAFSYWYYRPQTVGAANQELLLADLATIEGIFLGNFDPEPIKAAGCDFIMPAQTVVHDELEHPFGEPRLRVSVAEILFLVTAIIN